MPFSQRPLPPAKYALISLLAHVRLPSVHYSLSRPHRPAKSAFNRRLARVDLLNLHSLILSPCHKSAITRRFRSGRRRRCRLIFHAQAHLRRAHTNPTPGLSSCRRRLKSQATDTRVTIHRPRVHDTSTCPMVTPVCSYKYMGMQKWP